MYSKVGDYMANSTQLLKGIMEGVILKIISIEETYGYDIYQKLMDYGFTDFSEGSLYPLLLRLERNNYIYSIKRQSPLGPDRKYYSLTEDGVHLLKEFSDEWKKLSINMKKLWED